VPVSGYQTLIFHTTQYTANATATSVEIVLKFPNGSVVIRPQDEEEALEIPTEPQPKWLERAHSSLSGIAGLSSAHFDFPASALSNEITLLRQHIS